MYDSIFTMVRQAAGMVAKLFSAGEKFASAAENVGTWADESTAAFSDEARHKRKINNELQRKEFDLIAQDRQVKLAERKPKAIAQ